MPLRTFFRLTLFFTASLSFLAGGAAAQSTANSQEQPLLDDYDKFVLSSAASYDRFLVSTCAESKLISGQLNCSRRVRTYRGGLEGGIRQFLAERRSRREGENMARRLQQPLYNDPEVLKAGQLATEDCNKGDQFACVDLGIFTVKGLGVPRNQQRADLLFRKACAAGVTEGCGYLAIGYERNYPKEAADLYNRACFAGQGESYACERLAAMHEQGKGVPKDPPLAAALYKRRCDMWNNDASKCGEWSRVSKLGVPPADIGTRFAPQPSSNEATPPATP